MENEFLSCSNQLLDYIPVVEDNAQSNIEKYSLKKWLNSAVYF